MGSDLWSPQLHKLCSIKPISLNRQHNVAYKLYFNQGCLPQHLTEPIWGKTGEGCDALQKIEFMLTRGMKFKTHEYHCSCFIASLLLFYLMSQTQAKPCWATIPPTLHSHQLNTSIRTKKLNHIFYIGGGSQMSVCHFSLNLIRSLSQWKDGQTPISNSTEAPGTYESMVLVIRLIKQPKHLWISNSQHPMCLAR